MMSFFKLFAIFLIITPVYSFDPSWRFTGPTPPCLNSAGQSCTTIRPPYLTQSQQLARTGFRNYTSNLVCEYSNLSIAPNSLCSAQPQPSLLVTCYVPYCCDFDTAYSCGFFDDNHVFYYTAVCLMSSFNTYICDCDTGYNGTHCDTQLPDITPPVIVVTNLTLFINDMDWYVDDASGVCMGAKYNCSLSNAIGKQNKSVYCRYSNGTVTANSLCDRQSQMPQAYSDCILPFCCDTDELNFCNFQGVCQLNSTCVCDKGYTGVACETTIPVDPNNDTPLDNRTAVVKVDHWNPCYNHEDTGLSCAVFPNHINGTRTRRVQCLVKEISIFHCDGPHGYPGCIIKYQAVLAMQNCVYQNLGPIPSDTEDCVLPLCSSFADIHDILPVSFNITLETDVPANFTELFLAEIANITNITESRIIIDTLISTAAPLNVGRRLLSTGSNTTIPITILPANSAFNETLNPTEVFNYLKSLLLNPQSVIYQSQTGSYLASFVGFSVLYKCVNGTSTNPCPQLGLVEIDVDSSTGSSNINSVSDVSISDSAFFKATMIMLGIVAVAAFGLIVVFLYYRKNGGDSSIVSKPLIRRKK